MAAAAAAAQQQDRHHHRRLQRQAPGRGRSPANRAMAQRAKAPVDQQLLENSRHGAIPKIAPDGGRPSASTRSRAHCRRPRPTRRASPSSIGGLGISASGTADAIGEIAGAGDLCLRALWRRSRASWRQRARGGKHEVLLQVPMEPFDYPDNDPGPQTLLTTLSADQNIDRLHWLMSRFQGYVGIAELHGRALHRLRSRRWRRCCARPPSAG